MPADLQTAVTKRLLPVAIVIGLLALSAAAAWASVSANPASLTFGPQQVGTDSPTQTVTVASTTEPGSGTTTDVSLAVTGRNSNDFGIVNDQCSSNAIVAGSPCQFDVLFTPSAPGARKATVQVTGVECSTSGGGDCLGASDTQTVTATGRGTKK